MTGVRLPLGRRSGRFTPSGRADTPGGAKGLDGYTGFRLLGEV
jgi:hypothetical protein